MIKKSWRTIFSILLITILGGVLRFYNLDKIPVSLSVDEVSTGYNAYSILKTGKDEYGNFMPLSFRSLGDYKPPVFTYLVSVSEAIIGVNEFGVRFPSALFSTLAIPLFYFFTQKLLNNKTLALISTLLFAISPWQILFAHIAWEQGTSIFLMLAGVICLFKLTEGKLWSFAAAILLAASMYTYHSEKVFIPLIVAAYFLIKRKLLFVHKRDLALFIITSTILFLPLVAMFLFGPDKTRAQMTIITKDIEFIRNVDVGVAKTNIWQFFANSNFLLFFFWARKYLAYFQPSFLFFQGLGVTQPGTYGLGLMYLFEIPLFLTGLAVVVLKRVWNWQLILAWLILGIIPASLTITEQHHGRSFVISPIVIVISAIGALTLIKVVYSLKSKLLRIAIFGLFTLLTIWNFIVAYLDFTVHFPIEKAEAFMDGTKETVEYALANQKYYQEIVFDPVRGVDGPFIVSAPSEYILFYLKYDPSTYQTETKRIGKDSYGFSKFTIRSVDWQKDRKGYGVLFIASPWSLPEQNLKPSEIKKRVYLKNGKLAFLIVSPQKE